MLGGAAVPRAVGEFVVVEGRDYGKRGVEPLHVLHERTKSVEVGSARTQARDVHVDGAVGVGSRGHAARRNRVSERVITRHHPLDVERHGGRHTGPQHDAVGQRVPARDAVTEDAVIALPTRLGHGAHIGPNATGMRALVP